MNDYQVDLETFRGPLDLLLYLVKKHEVDIFDIPIARVTEQFLEYIRVLEWIDIDKAGDFLVMASTLMEIKSRMLLPRNEESPEEDEDPRLELVKQLLEYKKYRDAASLLEERAQQQSSRLPRKHIEIATGGDGALQPIAPVELWDLVSAFGRLMRETQALQPRHIVMDETPQHVYMEAILERLETQERVSFRELFTPPHYRSRLVGIFLAVLQLVRNRRVQAAQTEPFGEIWLTKFDADENAGTASTPARPEG
ncbi:MAG: segregation/condensation protein A [Gemmatales bacterium]|nr:MAG: segregation/condensation protein A [Gemmatales bacterium]